MTLPEQQLQLSVQEPQQRPPADHLGVAVPERPGVVPGAVSVQTLGPGGQGDDPGRPQVEPWGGGRMTRSEEEEPDSTGTWVRWFQRPRRGRRPSSTHLGSSRSRPGTCDGRAGWRNRQNRPSAPRISPSPDGRWIQRRPAEEPVGVNHDDAWPQTSITFQLLR